MSYHCANIRSFTTQTLTLIVHISEEASFTKAILTFEPRILHDELQLPGRHTDGALPASSAV
eukprot:757039-Hanusia_phi.AAC.1